MTIILKITNPFVYILTSVLLLSCNSDEEISPEIIDENQIAILTIGDSRVEGARPEFESWRYHLWKNMLEAEYSINFIGPLEDEANYPTFMGVTFDNDHGGIGGDTSEGVLDRLDQSLNSATRPADIVILAIGGNDLLGGTPVNEVISNINSILDQIQASNENVTIFLEQISGVRSDYESAVDTNKLLQDFNAAILDVSQNQSSSNSLIIPVDMSPNIPDSYFADEVHFNETGVEEIAKRYFEAIDYYLQEN